MADGNTRFADADRPDSPGKLSIQSSDIPIGRRSPSVLRLSVEDADEIARKLLDGRFYLSALEFHTELIETGKELSRLKEFFSNPGNFEIQSKFDPLALIRKTASNLTLDSIDDFARYSDDGFHVADERITVLEFELRKAKETIHELREQITQMTADTKDQSSLSIETSEGSANQYDIRTMNFLVNTYLLKRDYKFTSITFSEEVADQDLDDWEDVGLNAPQPPDLLILLHDYARHVIDPVKMRNQELDDLTKNVAQLTVKCDKLKEELEKEQKEQKDLMREIENLQAKPSKKNTILEKLKKDDDTKSISSVSSKASTVDSIITDRSELSPPLLQINDEILADKTSTEPNKNDKPFDESLKGSTGDLVDDSIENLVEKADVVDKTADGDLSAPSQSLDTSMEISEVSIDIPIDSEQLSPQEEEGTTDDDFEMNNVLLDNLSNECLVSREFIDLLFSTVHIKGESRLAQEVSKDEDVVPVDVIAKALPNVAPNVLLNKREELIPLILCSACFHEDAQTRDELLHMLFNLIKKPDKEQRKIIIDGCVAFAKRVGPTRVEAELLPQCWEQINHKFSERRLLVSETCGFISPYLPVELSGSLVFSMLSQMLQEDRSEEVRSSVIRSLALIVIFINDHTKYKKIYPLLELGLKDIVETVVMDTKEIFLPVFGIWASKMKKLQSDLLMQFLAICKQTLQNWHEANIANTADGESDALLLLLENKFNTYVDCLIRMVTTMFVDCLSNAPFSDDQIDDLDGFEISIEDSRIPKMKNTLQEPRVLIGDRQKFNYLVKKFDHMCGETNENITWQQLEWICDSCIGELCDMTGLMFHNKSFIEKVVLYMCTICRVFGKSYTQSKLVPYFQQLLRNPGATFLNDASPLASPVLTLFLCGVLANSQEDEHDKHLFTFTKQCLVQIATQKLPMEYLILSTEILSRNDSLQLGLIETLREAIVYPVAEVRACIAILFESLVGSVNQQLLSTHVAPAIITLINDRDMLVRISSIPALGTTLEVITDKNLFDRVCLQLQNVLDDPDCQKEIALQKNIIKSFTKIMPGIDSKFRDEFVLPRLKTMTEHNANVEDLTDRLEVAEELILALSAALCCFLQRDVIFTVVLPTLKILEENLKDFSPETVDSVLLLQKDAENKCEEDKLSAGSGASVSTSAKLFGGISSRFFKKKHEET